MRIRYCPKCQKAGLKWEDSQGRCSDGLTPQEQYNEYVLGKPANLERYDWRYCPRCQEWVNPNLSANFDQHKK